MKRVHLWFIAILLALAVPVAWSAIAGASSIHSGNNVSLSSENTIDDSVYAAGRTIDINSDVNGDVFCAGQNVTVSGTIRGDVICAGQSVHVTGNVEGDVRLAGQNVTLGAQVAGNATIGGQTFVLESTGSIGGDLTLGGSDATLNGTVERDVLAGGTSAIINNQVGRNIKAAETNLKLGSDARVGGNLELTSTNDVEKARGAVVNGKISRTEPPKDQAKSKHAAVFGFSFGWFVYWLAALLFTSFIVALVFPRMLARVTENALPRPWKALLTGFLAGFAVPAVLVLLAITVIGIPLALTVLLGWLIVELLAGTVIAYYIGRLVLRNNPHVLIRTLLGAAVLSILLFIPIVGFLALLATVWIGTGAILLEVFRRTPRPAYVPEAATSAPAAPRRRGPKTERS